MLERILELHRDKFVDDLFETIFSTALDAVCNISSFCVSKVAYNTALDIVHEFNTVQVE